MNKMKLILCAAMCVSAFAANAFAGDKDMLLECDWNNISVEKVEEMIKHGADVNAKDKDGHTFEYYANHSSGNVDVDG